ncbi:MAG: sigma-70 family RNA polymerase sigma factor [Planctomycetota bacterium]
MRPVFVESCGPEQHSPQTLLLVGRAKDGDRQAINDLLERYRDRLRRIARIRLSADLRRSVDTSDVLQDALLVAFRNLDSFELRSDASVIQWLSKILENQIRDAAKYFHAQKRDVSRSTSLEGAVAESSNVGDIFADGGAPNPSEVASNAEIREIYDACVEELSPAHREVVLLRDYAGGSWDFVGQQMQRTSEAVQELYRRAQVKLCAQLARRLG